MFRKVIDDGWMICYFMSFSTIFLSYQDNGQLIMKGCLQWNPFKIEKILASLMTARLVGQLNPLSYQGSLKD